MKILAVLLVVAASLSAADMVAIWNPNTEDDLAGYNLFLRADTTEEWLPAINLPKDSTTYHFIWANNIGVCAMITAYDQAGNVSDPSPVYCLAVEPEPLLGDMTGDGRLSAADIIEWRRLFRADPANPALDLNKNGMNTAADLVLLRQIVKDASFKGGN